MTNKLKILNDPIYGFVRIPNSLIFDILEHPSFQRLRRISQMGLSNLVYTGANHTRFHHAIGCLHLMQKTVSVLRMKRIDISLEEENALLIAILLHDMGHGAFSHALEHSIVTGISHEEISLKYMQMLNIEFKGQLDLAIDIFTGKYHRVFLHQLISSQLDIDRLDYLKRDSFYSGVVEGNISSDRLIAMMNVVNNELVIEKKGIYSVEKFLTARRFMYWQVYLHKTVLVSEHMLVKILQRAKELAVKKVALSCSSPLHFFLFHKIDKDNFGPDVLDLFSKIDDYDILQAIKEWTNHSDKTLATLSSMIVNRDLLKIEMCHGRILDSYTSDLTAHFMKKLHLSKKETGYFVFTGEISNRAYDQRNPIKIMDKYGKLDDFIGEYDQLNLQSLSKPSVKFFICYPKEM